MKKFFLLAALVAMIGFTGCTGCGTDNVENDTDTAMVEDTVADTINTTDTVMCDTL